LRILEATFGWTCYTEKEITVCLRCKGSGNRLTLLLHRTAFENMSVQAYNQARGTFTADQKGADIKVELLDITEKLPRWGDQSEILLTRKRHQAKEEDDRYKDYAIVLRRKLDYEDKPISTSLEIKSAIIRQGLKDVFGEYPFINLGSETVEIYRPYEPLFHFRSQLRAYAADVKRTGHEAKHWQVLTDFMEHNLQETERDHERLLPSGMISYKVLWTIFLPETVVIVHGDYFDECYVVESFRYMDLNGKDEFQIVARSWDFNGARFGPKNTELTIPLFVGNQSITSLSVFPITYDPRAESEALETRLIGRGRMWRDILKITNCQYDGKYPLIAASSALSACRGHNY